MSRGKFSTFIAASCLLGMEEAWDRFPFRKEEKREKCGLSGCMKKANSGGYCSAEHCKEHKQMRRTK